MSQPAGSLKGNSKSSKLEENTDYNTSSQSNLSIQSQFNNNNNYNSNNINKPQDHSLNQFNLDRDFEDTLDFALENIDPKINPFATNNNNNLNKSTDNIDTYSLKSFQKQSFVSENSNSNMLPNTNSLNTDNISTKSNSSTNSLWSKGVSSVFNTTKRLILQNKKKIHLPDDYDIYNEDNNTPNNNNTSSISTLDNLKSRTIIPHMDSIYSTNAVSNAKYNVFSFFPIILYEQFKFFFNLYFLLVALSQAIPALRIGYLSSYVVPLVFVLSVTMSKEAIDDILRRHRDREQNNELYEVLGSNKLIMSKDLKCGDLVKLHKDIRIPADMILLQSSEKTGESFIKTDQLDGETDWKLRIACSLTQSLSESELEMIKIQAQLPTKDIHKFLGNLTYGDNVIGLTVDQTLWANTVLASGTCIGCIIYTGKDTKQAMNTSTPRVKVGLLELEINQISKVLCISVFLLSVGLVFCQGFSDDWYVDIMRFLILFSTIIPVSLRVNLDLGKSVYSYQIQHDANIPSTIVRTSTIPEDLGRIEYLLTDKTGTLTQNEMEMKKIHLGTVSYTGDTMDLVKEYVNHFNEVTTKPTSRRDLGIRVRDLILTLAICHNVTPTVEDNILEYQAASPDEVAIVKFTQSVGLSLIKRDRSSISLLHVSTGKVYEFEILQVFPFNSDTKRMGIVVYDKTKDEYWFYEKGADTVMTKIVVQNDWLEEETNNMAREGLRTLVIGRKKLNQNIYNEFKTAYENASSSMTNREVQMQKVITQYLEYDLELLGLTGVEDKLQVDVKSSIECLRNAGIKIWMLTGDKVETARCIGISTKLISRGQYVHTIEKLRSPEIALQQIEILRTNINSCLLIDGESLSTYLHFYPNEFFDISRNLPAVIACRCTPQQKADVAILIRESTGKRVCCIGDGGNDVSMIQSANVGVGIVGKEGKQASIAADFSITQFCHLTKLLLWHGRNSYKRSAKLAQFVIHRGLIISICQVVYSVSSKFEPLALYQGWLMVGYATCYTMAPVFSLVLDYDVSENLVTLYPELYKELTAGKSLSFKTFFVWLFVSIFQGGVIQGISQGLVGLSATSFTSLVSLSFTALILNELAMVALEINTWNKSMLYSELVTLAIYIGSVPFLSDYFNLSFVGSFSFYWQCTLILAVSLIPIWAAKAINRKLRPPTYAKVQQV
ncbi:putative aminophospholipid-translocase [Pichia californica]|uniref:Phospholipid-transporting ATPase n=1 Tax=Pichia californica TaxID=460514 RepID=A0A9P6WPR1_9ASCO|nr:putative aminophospholipid-translocase [[Candida] californica]KAG0690022.1 putative aminophospholipid-translocase [[Candida] californica]